MIRKLMKNVMLGFLALALVLTSNYCSVSADVPASEVMYEEISDNNTAGEARIANYSHDVTIKAGKTVLIKSFCMQGYDMDPHNEFKVRVSNVKGSTYKVHVYNNKNNKEFLTKEHSGGCTVTVTNANSKATYYVKIMNTGTKTLTAHVTISSYYN